ncbi:MAG: hypothetical protein KDM63_08770, partial [Verrucomicrobiae bacterium]|nr:hypothetical protein [Verrucomicrobiae bacterium]
LGGIGYSDDADIHPISGELMLCGHKPRVWSLDGARWTFNARSVNQRYSIAFAGRDDWVFCPSSSHEMALQHLEGQSPETIWTPETGSSYNLADVSADGKVVALARYLAKDAPIPLLRREGETLEQVGTFSPTRHVHSIRLSPSGRHLVANFYSANYFEHFDTSTGVKSTVHTSNEFRQMNDIAWIGEETLIGLMTGNNYRGNPGSEEHIVVWDAASGEIIRRAASPTFMDALAIEPGGKRFAEAGNNKHVRIRDAATLKVLADFRAHDDSITALAWHPKKPILATGSADLTIRLWNLETGERIDEFRGPLAAPLQLSFSPSGQRLGCASQDSNVRIWDPISLRDESEPPLAEDASMVDGDEWFGNTLPSSRAKLKIDSEGWMHPLDNVTPELMEAVATKWKRVEGGFLSPAATAAALPLPGDLSGTSYTVRVGLRKEGDPGVFHLTLPIGDGMVGFELHGKEEYAGLHMVDGKRVESSPGVVEGIQIADSERHDLELTVRLDGPSVTITTTLDDLPLYEWKGAKARLSRGELWAKSTPPGFLSLGAYREGWEVCDVKVKLLSREDAPYALSTSRYSDVEIDGEGWIDLLSALNPDFDWDFLRGIQVEDGVLWNTKGNAAKLALPGDFAGSSYQVAVKIRRLRIGDLFRIQLPVDDRHVRFQIDAQPGYGYRTGLSDVDGEGVLTSPQGLKGQIIDDLEVHDLEISVRLLGEEVEIVSLLDGDFLHEWKGKIASLEDNTRPGNWPSGAIGLTVHSDDWEISEIRARRTEIETTNSSAGGSNGF